jgi:thiosulfate dehydrogenase [quinone] large subunit
MARYREFQDPPVARWFFNSTAPAVIVFWLVARMYIGLDFLESGWRKFNNPAWMETGAALKGAWAKAVIAPESGTAQITFDWYREFINVLLVGGHHTWFAKFLVLGEIAVGLGLILGVLTGIAAFFAAFMNWNFLMLGIVSVNPVFLPIGIGLMLAWKVAGYYGIDRWLLPALGTPWQPGELFAPSGSLPGSRPPLPSMPQ